jgi:transcriptional regulator with XRE-family HTH domain
MAAKARTAKKRSGRRKAAPTEIAQAAPRAASGALPAMLVRGLGMLGDLGGRVAASRGIGLQVGRALLSPEAARMRRDAGRTVRELRELAGLTRDELASAIDLSDRSLLAAVEKGTATLSFELILRLSSLLARNDPVPFVAKLTRTYNPALWKLLEGWGIGRIPLQLERERRFVNVFRAHDTARQLSDEDFEHVLDFTRAAFEMALGLAAQAEGLPAPRKRRRRRR